MKRPILDDYGYTIDHENEEIDDYIDREIAIKSYEQVRKVLYDLNLDCAYGMPSFWYNNGKDYKVIPTQFSKGYMKALEDVERKIKPILEDLVYGVGVMVRRTGERSEDDQPG